MRFVRHRVTDINVHETLRSWRAFRPALAGESRRIAVAVGLALVVTALELLRPWPIKWVIDYVVSSDVGQSTVDRDLGQAIRTVVPYALAAMAIPIALGATTHRLTMEVAKVGRKATVRIRRQLFDHMQRLEIAEHQARYGGDLLVRLMGDVNMIRDLLFTSWLTVISRGTVLAGTLIVFAFLDWRLLLIALIPLPWLWVGVTRTSRRVRTAAGKQRRKEGAIAAYAAETLRHVSLVKAFGAEERMSERFRRDARSAERATLAATRHSAEMARTTEIVIGVGVGLVLGFGTVFAISGAITPGELVVAMSYARLIYKPIRKLTAEGARVAKATACAGRVIDILDLPVESSAAGTPVPTLDGRIHLHHVNHRYSDGRSSLNDVSLHVAAGDLVAVVGENGSGKSTLLSLLLRLHSPESGTISIDGHRIESFDLADYRSHIAYVPQELALFGGTVRDNIIYGKPSASDSEVERAAALALFGAVADRLPEGYDTILNEDGGSLSGGEARRLMLARAAIRDASILLLDEPLAGLDPEARRTVAQAISRIATGRTTLVVHHGDLEDLDPDLVVSLSRGHLTSIERHAVGPIGVVS